METYETWLRNEIASAEAKASALRDALQMFLRSTQSVNVVSPKVTAALKTIETTISNNERAKRRSKYQPMFGEFIKADRPLSIGEMQALAAHAGVEIDRHNLRSIVFNQKKAGHAIEEDGRYLWLSSAETETASPVQEDAVQS